jgi:uncharacterized protein YndB with AHSA1/START domain
MSARHLDLVSHWRIAAPVEQVWAALTDAESWPRWWPQVRSVRTLKAGGADGLGSVRRIEWATRLPCDTVIEVEAIESMRHERLRGSSRSPWRGEGIWLLRSEGRFTDVTCVWRLVWAKRWMRWLTPLLAPLLRWNYERVMRAGGIGLVRHLQAGERAGARR